MLNFKKLGWMFAAILGLGLFVACDEKEQPTPEPQNPPVIVLDLTEVEAPKEGARFTVEYHIENLVQGKTATVTPNADWIVDMDLSLAGIMIFHVAKNRVTEPRETTIDVAYEGAETVSLTVKQEAGDPPAFTNGNVSVTVDSYTMDLYPLNKELPFIRMSASQDYIDELGGTDEDIIADDFAYFEWLGSYFYGQTLSSMLADVAKYGDQLAVTARNGQPITDYVLYAYHIDIEACEATSEVYRFPVRTANVNQVEAEFEFEVAINEATANVQANVTNGYSGRFYFDAMPKVVVDRELEEGQTVGDYLINWWNTIVSNEYSGGASTADVLANCSQISDTYAFELLQLTEYYLFAFAVDPTYAFAASTPVVATFTTEEVSMSDNIITPYVKQIGSQGAVMGFETTNYDPYFAGYITKEKWDAMPDSEQGRFESLKTDNANESLNGDIEVSVVNLTPETDYVIYAFGSAGGVMTTQMFTLEFATTAQGAGGGTMTLETPGYFDIYDICAIDDGYNGYLGYADSYCLFPFKIILDPADSELFYWDIWNFTNATYSDEQLIYGLINSSRQDITASVYILPYNAPMCFAGLVVDEAGYGPLCRYDFTTTRDGVGDAEDYFEFLSTMYSAPRMQQAKAPVVLEQSFVIPASACKETAPVVEYATEFKTKAEQLFPAREPKVDLENPLKIAR